MKPQASVPPAAVEDPLRERRGATTGLSGAKEATPELAREPASGAVEPAKKGGTWANMVGLHPFVAFGMVAVDMMLFGGEAATGGVALTVTIPIALALTVPCVLLQKYSFGDNWGAALGKGLMVGVLTAIPFPIGSPVTILGAILGWRRKPGNEK